eukprot:358445-Chlamydomonas_euryale.AAC.13
MSPHVNNAFNRAIEANLREMELHHSTFSAYLHEVLLGGQQPVPNRGPAAVQEEATEKNGTAQQVTGASPFWSVLGQAAEADQTIGHTYSGDMHGSY